MEQLKTCLFPHAETNDEADKSSFKIDFDVFVSKESKKDKKEKIQPRFRVVVSRSGS